MPSANTSPNWRRSPTSRSTPATSLNCQARHGALGFGGGFTVPKAVRFRSTPLRRSWPRTLGLAFGIAVLSLIVWLVWKMQAQDIEIDLRAMAATRVHSGPITADNPNDPVSAEAVSALAPLRAARSNREDGLGYVDMPAFGTKVVAVALSDGHRSNTADGTYVVFERSEHGLIARGATHFEMPRTAYIKLVKRLDRLNFAWFGDRGSCYDGEEIALEEKVKNHLFSEVGNAACSHHYGAIKFAVEQAVAGYSTPRIRELM